jgi:mutator protein MutT
MIDKCVEGVVAVLRREGRLLVIRRAEGIAAPGAWCFPGGAIEAGETVEQALIREIVEELGVAIRPGRQVWQWRRPDGGLLLHWLLAEFDDDGPIVPNPAEVAEARWVTAEEFRRLEPALESNLLFMGYWQTVEERSKK